MQVGVTKVFNMLQMRYANCSSWDMQAAPAEVCKLLLLRYANGFPAGMLRYASCYVRGLQAAPAEICKLHQPRYASCTSSDIHADAAEIWKLRQLSYAGCSGWGMQILQLMYANFISRDMQEAPTQVYKLLSRCLQAASWGMKAAPWLQLRHASCFRWSTVYKLQLRYASYFSKGAVVALAVVLRLKKDYYYTTATFFKKEIDVTARLFIFNIVYVRLTAFLQICLILGKQHLLLSLKPRKAAALVAFNAYRKVLNLKKCLFKCTVQRDGSAESRGIKKKLFPYYIKHCGCWDRTQNLCNWCIDSQTL